MIRVFRAALLALAFVAGHAQAQLSIEITGGAGSEIPIAIVPFAGESALPGITDVVEEDLAKSGRFRTLFVGPQNPPLNEASKVDFPAWRSRTADALVVGGVYPVAGGYEVRFQLYDVPKQTSLDGLRFTITPAQARAAAHRIADYIYEKLTGDKGIFSTRIAYVEKRGSQYQLIVADADGVNGRPMLTSNEPIMSPAWSPDGTRLAYVSFQQKKPVVYVQRLSDTRQPPPVANFRGSNSAPGWSPDGRRLAVVLSRDGGTQLFLMNADGTGVRRLMSSSAIDTEPFFSPDGQWVYFASDRGGGPQIYRVSTGGGEVQRVTFSGDYNVTPRVSPDGKTLVYVSRNAGRFQVVAMDLATRQTRAITEGGRDESPSFAPNGKMILYATHVGGRGVLARTLTDRSATQRISMPAGDVREPAWGPFSAN